MRQLVIDNPVINSAFLEPGKHFITRMNPDLAMDTADQKLLKSTGAGNLFMVFGEPDLELRTLPGGKLQVELRGLDVYDPTSGEIRSSSTDSNSTLAPATLEDNVNAVSGRCVRQSKS